MLGCRLTATLKACWVWREDDGATDQLFPLFKQLYLEEERPEVRSSFLHAIRELDGERQEARLFFEAAYDREKGDELRSVAALGAFSAAGSACREDIFSYLLDFYAFLQEKTAFGWLPTASHRDPWGPAISETHIVDACVDASSLADLGKARHLAAIMSEPPQLFRFVEKLLFALVPRVTSENLTSGSRWEGDTYVVQFGRSHQEPFTLQEEVAMLPGSLLPIVALILHLDPFWQVQSNMLNLFGLPHDRRALRDLYNQVV